MASRVALAANDSVFQPCLMSYPPSVCLAMVRNCCRGVHREECTANLDVLWSVVFHIARLDGLRRRWFGRWLTDVSLCVMVKFLL